MRNLHKMQVALIVCIVLLILWTLWGYFSSRVEQAEYEVIHRYNEYEIREYPPHLVAQTTVEGSYDEGLNTGFRILAGYIFGKNTTKEKIAMTAPVTAGKTTSEKIAMTAPVLATSKGDTQVISFGMPRAYTLETLPTPNDARVKIVEMPTRKVAVLRFGWPRTDKRVSKMRNRLLDLISRDGVQIQGVPFYAGYNAPWTPPWMVRNEVMAEVKY